jgi:Ca2+-binding RTX toxin-like protein
MTRRPTRRSLRLESLESRRLMAYDISFDDGILQVEGGAGNDQIEIFYDDDDIVVEIRDRASGNLIEDYDLDADDVEQMFVYAYEGDDWIYNMTAAPMRAYGHAGNDTIIGGVGDEYLDGGAGNDELYGMEGNDVVYGGAGDDVLGGGAGDDNLFGSSGNDRYLFNSWNTGNEVVVEWANSGVDTLDFSSWPGPIDINLTLTTTQSLASTLSVNLYSAPGIENVWGTEWDDVIRGNSLSNYLDGGSGNDELYGLGGHDTLVGGEGNDLLQGGGGNDWLLGGQGNDTYRFAGSGLGSDTITETSGIDTLDFSQFATGVTVDLSADVYVNSAGLTLSRFGGVLENVIGTAYDDTLLGNSADNILWGGDGNDTLRGGDGLDYLYGEAGSDTLNSDAVDQLFGGAGIDFFDTREESFLFRNPKIGLIRDWGVK